MKKYKYNGKIYCDEKLDIENYGGDFGDLLYAISFYCPNIYNETTVNLRFIGGEYYATDDEKSDEETLDEIVECGYEEVEEIK